MEEFPEKLWKKLEKRKVENAFRQLSLPGAAVDFSSNDYLGFNRKTGITERAEEILKSYSDLGSGATGSRLLTGNNRLYEETEEFIADFHSSPSALIFNSGYTANLGILGSIPQRGDIILYDELIHASIREGIVLSKAKSYKFKHNDPESLLSLLKRLEKAPDSEVYVVTETVFSMDGDSPELKKISSLCKEYNCRLIVDEAHAIGISQKGMVVDKGIENDVFARIVTFGKALGCHGAAVLCSETTKSFLVNFARSFIYTTALPPHTVASIKAAYEHLGSLAGEEEIGSLKYNISTFRKKLEEFNLQRMFLSSESAIQSMIMPGNDRARSISEELQKNGFDIRPILSPTVPVNKERLRICLHAFNTEAEMEEVIQRIAIFAS